MKYKHSITKHKYVYQLILGPTDHFFFLATVQGWESPSAPHWCWFSSLQRCLASSPWVTQRNALNVYFLSHARSADIYSFILSTCKNLLWLLLVFPHLLHFIPSKLSPPFCFFFFETKAGSNLLTWSILSLWFLGTSHIFPYFIQIQMLQEMEKVTTLFHKKIAVKWALNAFLGQIGLVFA